MDSRFEIIRKKISGGLSRTFGWNIDSLMDPSASRELFARPPSRATAQVRRQLKFVRLRSWAAKQINGRLDRRDVVVLSLASGCTCYEIRPNKFARF